MPIRLPPSTVRVPVAPKPDPASPAPAPAVTKPVVGPALPNTGTSTFVNTRGGVRDPSIGVRDHTIGVRDHTIGTTDNGGTGGVRDHSIGVRDHSIGSTDVGELGPTSGAYETAVKDTIAKYLETPSYLRDDAPTSPAPSSRASLTDAKAAVATALTPKQGTALLDLAQKNPAIGNRLAGIAANLSGLTADAKTALLGTLARAPDSASAKVLEHVVGSAVWKGLSAADKNNLVKVMSSASEKGLVGLGALLEGTPDAVGYKDAKGKSLLSDLATLASQPLNSGLYGGTTGQKLLDETLLQVANPDRVEQGDAPTCTVTSMQFELVRDDPAEYVRLMAGLTGTAGKATMRGGSDLKLVPNSLSQLAGREATQDIFQTAAMEYGNGADNYDVTKAVSTGGPDNTSYSGLMPRQQTLVLKQLFGVKYETKTLETPAQAASALQHLRDYVSVGKNRPVLLEIDQGNYNHAVTFEMEKDSRVYFRDPYGQLRSMPDAAFLAHVVAVHQPVDLPQ